MSRIVLINPNTNGATTAMMTEVARASAPESTTVEGLTAPYGAPLITTPADLAKAEEAVASLSSAITAIEPDGVIIAAFGDPGVRFLADVLPCPVVGIAEAAMARAVRMGPFAVVTTTPDLVPHIEAMAERFGWKNDFCGVWLTSDDPAALMGNSERLTEALATIAQAAVLAGARSIVVGGGPLALAAQSIAENCSVTVVEPVPEAVRVLCARLQTEPFP